MLIDGIRVPLGADISDTVINTSDRVTTLPGTVTNGRYIELTQQDGIHTVGIYKGVSGSWVLQDDTMNEKFTTVNTNVTNVTNTVTTVSFYDIAGNIAGKPDASVSVIQLVTPRAYDIPASFSGAKAICSTASTSSAVFTIKRWNSAHSSATTLGTISFSAGNKVGVFNQSGSGVMSFAVGETLDIVSPGSVDSTLADIAFVISSTLV